MSKKVLITGATGQIGTELAYYLGDKYGKSNIIASGRREDKNGVFGDLCYEIVDVQDGAKLKEIVQKHRIDTIVNLAAILSAKGEQMPQATWNINVGGLINVLEVAKDEGCMVFTPSSIAAFGDSTPKDNTPQVTIQRPSTMYGVTKVAGEILSDYYFHKFGVDTRGVRYPGIISYKTLPGGGTTDYAVHIYFEALRNKSYASFIAEGTKMDMMYMPDALKAVYDLMEADPEKLEDRNAFNVTAMSFAPEDLAKSIKKFIPEFQLTYDVDPVRQAIADSWPNSLDDSAARKQWGWDPEFDIDKMSEDMLKNIKL